jgi:urease alpha subunit
MMIHRHAQQSASSRTRSKAFKGRTIHALHTEGAGGSHRWIIKIAGSERAAVLDQSDATPIRATPSTNISTC